MLSFQRGGRPRFILALLLLTAVTLATLDARGFGPVESTRGLAMSVLSPFRSVADWATSPVASTWNGVFGYRNLEEENARLRAELAALQGDEFREETARHLLERILVQSDLTFAGDVPQVLTRVIAGPVNNFEDTVTIDKGSNDGIRVGMPVVTGAGLVGRVDRVTGSTAVVQLISDPRMKVGARLVTTGEQGIIEGRGRGRGPELVVSGSVVVAAGEQIQTSGLAGSLYPPDIPIGRIAIVAAESEDDDDTTTTTIVDRSGIELPALDAVASQRVAIELSADLDTLTFLTVLLWEPSE